MLNIFRLKMSLIWFVFLYLLFHFNTAVLAQATVKHLYDNNSRLKYTISGQNVIEYRYDQNGNMLAKTAITANNNVIAPNEISISDASYDVIVYDVPLDVTQVVFPSWTSLNGQDDLKLISGTQIGSGIWKATVILSEHNNETGTYYTHIYGYDAQNNSTFLGGYGVNVKATVSARAPAQVKLSEKSYDIYVDGVGSNVTRVEFPTWTEANGQDDIKIPWIQGVKVADGTWKMTISFGDHSYETGIYTTHIYSSDSYGNKQPIAFVQVEALADYTAPAEVSISEASYDVHMYGVPESVAKVEFPTWTDWNGRDDLENPWIVGEKVEPGVWKITVPFSKHNYEHGIYYTDIHYVHADGTRTGIGGVVVNVKPTVSVRMPAQVKLSEKSYDIYVDGIGPNVAKVEFPTWTEANGQDDIKHPWIQGVKVADGTWKMTILFSDHSYEPGIYNTDIYSSDSYGNKQILANIQVEALADYTAPAEVSVSEASYDVYMYGVPESVAAVEFPTWTAWNGQDDLENPWIVGEKVEPGVWKITVPFSKHNYEHGIYYTDIHYVHADGTRTGIGGVVVNVKPTVSVRVPAQVKLSENSYDIYVDGIGPNVAKVEFPTWTEANGQDDIKYPWIQGVKAADGTWKMTILLSDHSYETGIYNTHIYSSDSYGNKQPISFIQVEVIAD